MREWFAKPLDNDVRTVQALVEAWKSSDMLDLQQTGINYYMGNHDILNEEFAVIEASNRVTRNINKRIVDNQYKRIVDQKNNYSFGKPFTIQHADETYAKELSAVFTKLFNVTLRRITLDMMNCGVAYAYLYYDQEGTLQIERFKPWECIPIWKDEAHDMLSMLIHVVDVSYVDAGRKINKYMYEVYEPDGVTSYDEKFQPLAKTEPYLRIDGEPYNWERLPIVQFKLNDNMTPLVANVKTLQDALNLYESTYYNNVTKDVRDTVFVLKGYPDTDLSTFYSNIMTLGAIAVDGDGDVEMLSIKTNPADYNIMVKELKKAIVENAMSYWRDLDNLGTNVNQMNILSMYSDIDLDADSIESEVGRAFNDILWFVNTHLDRPLDMIEGVSIVFNRNMLMNESETIANITASAGVVSQQTLIAQHPWVNNPAAELALLAKEEPVDTNTNENNSDNVDNVDKTSTIVNEASD